MCLDGLHKEAMSIPLSESAARRWKSVAGRVTTVFEKVFNSDMSGIRGGCCNPS